MNKSIIENETHPSTLSFMYVFFIRYSIFRIENSYNTFVPKHFTKMKGETFSKHYHEYILIDTAIGIAFPSRRGTIDDFGRSRPKQ